MQLTALMTLSVVLLFPGISLAISFDIWETGMTIHEAVSVARGIPDSHETVWRRSHDNLYRSQDEEDPGGTAEAESQGLCPQRRREVLG